MKKTLWLLVLLAGCSYYEHKSLTNQPLPEENKKIIRFYEKVYPFVEVYNPQEIDAMIEDQREGSCQFQAFAAFWEYYHDQWSDAQTQTQKILNESICSLSHYSGYWMNSLLYEDKQQWNKGLIALAPLFQNPAQTFYTPALGLSYRLQKARTTSLQDLSPEEIGLIETQRKILESYQGTPIALAQKYNVVFIYEKTPPIAFFECFLKAFENQEAIESISFFSKDSPRKEVLHALQHPQSLLIGYYLSQPLPKEYLMESLSSITIGDDFIRHRSVDYWIADPMVQLLQSVRMDPFFVDPQMILYEESVVSKKVQKSLINYSKAINLTTLGLQETLKKLMNFPQRQEAFQSVFNKKILYLPQPALLPHTILCLVHPETLRLLNTQLILFGQGKTLLLADASSMSADSAFDKQLHGVVISTHPFERDPHYRDDMVLAADLIELMIRLPRFANEKHYVYHGQMGAYTLRQTQQLSYQRWWTRYHDGEVKGSLSSN